MNLTKEDRRILIVALTNRCMEIQRVQIDPMMSYIEEQLRIMYPTMTEQDAQDWSCELISCTPNLNISEILNRIDDYFKK